MIQRTIIANALRMWRQGLIGDSELWHRVACSYTCDWEDCKCMP